MTASFNPSSVVVAAGQAELSTLESGVLDGFTGLVTTLSKLGTGFVGSTATNFGNFVTSYTQAVEANPTKPGVYTSAFKTAWANFEKAESGLADADLAEAIGAVGNLFDNVLVQIADAAGAFSKLL